MSAELARDHDWPSQPLAPLEQPFLDDRGAIRPLVETVMRSALIIESKTGAVRGNHYHLTDWHYCYVVSGTMEYYHRPAGSEQPPERLVVRAGQMVFSPPMVEHAMRFPEDTVFLTLSRNPRDQSAYEADVVRTKLI
jgi:quercetin dioxygenase-like cupin family protein